MIDLSVNDLLNIELRNKGNEDVTELVREVCRLRDEVNVLTEERIELLTRLSKADESIFA